MAPAFGSEAQARRVAIRSQRIEKGHQYETSVLFRLTSQLHPLLHAYPNQVVAPNTDEVEMLSARIIGVIQQLGGRCRTSVREVASCVCRIVERRAVVVPVALGTRNGNASNCCGPVTGLR